ncbi:fumarylacetoacetate hydrolase family protein [Thalassotalea hakodatensis]|uniref:fumarylacetoacetate hydrolase family protein n=1 Tax=Thalassotalea hakodatensis TaxID=3030492 RepID=UPI0025745D70|nr:fumarylacetoacetate hydrolase family protein [Thalassotalea hakodatensis]
MKLLRVGPLGQEKPAAIDKNGDIRDLSYLVEDISGAQLSQESLNKLAEQDLTTLPLIPEDTRIGACVGNVGKFVCIGLNYKDHAEEANMPIPTEPVVFNKWTSAICGPNDDIVKPSASIKMDWEVELGIVIGEDAKNVSEADALDYVAGYCLINDVSERHFQLEISGGQWDKGKGCDTFGPTGPWMVTKDEVGDVHNLDMKLSVNGTTYQNGNTKTMIFKPAFIVSYLSRFMTLNAGDIISTGTPPGVGMGQSPEVFLNVGDKITLSISGLGEQSQTVVAES